MMEYLIIALFVWVVAATVLVWHNRRKIKNAMEKLQKCQEKNMELTRKALLWENNHKEYRIANQSEANLLGCLPVIQLGHNVLHPVFLIEMVDEKPRLTLVRADVLVEGQQEDGKCQAADMREVKHLSAEEYEDFFQALASGFKD